MTKKTRRRLKPSRLFIFLGLLFIMLAGGGTIGLLFVSVKDIPAWNSNALLSSNSTVIYDKDNKLIAKVGVENRVPVNIKDIPEPVQQAFLAAEDHRFYQHYGIDVKGIARAFYTDIVGGGKYQGASTITQQLVKLSFLTPEKTFKRKIQEVILALQVEHYYTKPEIFEMYLNKIYFGQGAYGIEAASQTYFKKDVKQLTLAEASMLAGIPKSPNYYSPQAEKETPQGQPHQSKIRQELVLELMTEYGYISKAKADAAYKEELTYAKASTQYPYPYFVDYITELLIKKYGEERVYNSGLKVYTTMDSNIQSIVENVMSDEKNFPPPKGKERPEGAVVVMDPSKGYIRAIVGGREHTSRLGWNRATRKPGRQPGSTFKPIIAYGPSIEYTGKGPATVIDDAPVKYGSYEPPNNDKDFKGLITLRTALVNSVNVVAVKLLMDYVTIPRAIEFASRLGIDIDINSVGPSLALGTEEVTPLQMAGAYSAFANGGVYNDPVAILKVEGADGSVLEENKPSPKQAMKPTTAFLMTDMMKSVTQEGTGKFAYFGRPAAGKTGTTDDGKDIWFAGFTPDLTAIVYLGYDQPTPMKEAFGGGFPAKIWNKVMSQAHKNIPVRDFDHPQGIVTATVDSKSGFLPGPNTPTNHLVTDYFAAGTVPTEVDNTHVQVELCAESGLLANKECPNKVVRSMVKLPYSVPNIVADFGDRIPTTTCNLHGPGAGISSFSSQIRPPDSKPQQRTDQRTDTRADQKTDARVEQRTDQKTDTKPPSANSITPPEFRR